MKKHNVLSMGIVCCIALMHLADATGAESFKLWGKRTRPVPPEATQPYQGNIITLEKTTTITQVEGNAINYTIWRVDPDVGVPVKVPVQGAEKPTDKPAGHEDWDVSKVTLKPAGGALMWQSGNHLPVSWRHPIGMEDVVIEFDGWCEKNGLNVVWRNGEGLGYMVLLGGWFNTKSYTEVGRSGERSEFVNGSHIRLGQWQHYRIVRSGDWLDGYLDGQRIIHRQVPQHFNGNGTLVFMSYGSLVGVAHLRIYRAVPSPVISPDPGTGKFDQAVALLCAPDADFIRSLYHCITHREPTAQELQSQVGRLQGGVSRQQMVMYFFASPGYVNQNHDGVRFMRDACQAIYGRQPTAAELKAWPRTQRSVIISDMFKSREHLNATAGCANLWRKAPVHEKSSVDHADSQNKKLTAGEAYQQYISAYNALAKLMAAGKGNTPQGQAAYQKMKHYKDLYEASIRTDAGKTTDKPAGETRRAR